MSGRSVREAITVIDGQSLCVQPCPILTSMSEARRQGKVFRRRGAKKCFCRSSLSDARTMTLAARLLLGLR